MFRSTVRACLLQPLKLCAIEIFLAGITHEFACFHNKALQQFLKFLPENYFADNFNSWFAHGFCIRSSMLFIMKLKSADRCEYIVLLFCCFLPSVILLRKLRKSSEETSSRSLSPKVKLNFVRIASYDHTVFGLEWFRW